ncbi:hypothetical protein BSU04_41750 [Caballeronia sordidicola]|uniref:Uncharacterized protein n=1 Tax=Caballeronia sordidicola TaxID=196367 RepID=A0A226WMM7_CABSO|nr:hypothetical protein BSU04_41750 [Caballeronia sordidicola]
MDDLYGSTCAEAGRRVTGRAGGYGIRPGSAQSVSKRFLER